MYFKNSLLDPPATHLETIRYPGKVGPQELLPKEKAPGLRTILCMARLLEDDASVAGLKLLVGHGLARVDQVEALHEVAIEEASQRPDLLLAEQTLRPAPNGCYVHGGQGRRLCGGGSEGCGVLMRTFSLMGEEGVVFSRPLRALCAA